MVRRKDTPAYRRHRYSRTWSVLSRPAFRLLAHAWGVLPNERVKTSIIGLLGPRFIVSVWAVIFDEGERVLLFHHTHDWRHPWGLPSGRLERDEAPELALEREFREEVGGALRIKCLVAALCEPGLPVLRLVYACEIATPPASPSVEVDRWDYFPAGDLPPGVRSVQREAIARARVEPPPGPKEPPSVAAWRLRK